jgi:hypothetical protein
MASLSAWQRHALLFLDAESEVDLRKYMKTRMSLLMIKVRFGRKRRSNATLGITACPIRHTRSSTNVTLVSFHQSQTRQILQTNSRLKRIFVLYSRAACACSVVGAQASSSEYQLSSSRKGRNGIDPTKGEFEMTW